MSVAPSSVFWMSAEPPHTIELVEPRDVGVLWQRTDTALERMSEVWIRSPLLSRLYDPLGRVHDGRQWLVLQAREREVRPVWLHRLRDVLLSVLALIVLAPLFLVVGLLVKLSSPGPVFYSTTVVGKDRDPFKWYKFRSMRVVPDTKDVEQRHARFRRYVADGDRTGDGDAPKKVIDNHRVTRVGRFIRRHSIDELPQLWNVLRGEMTLVGPRPCLPYEAESFTGWRSRRFGVRPGLTGVWQVYGRGRVPFDEGAAMDVYYTYRQTLGFDLALILKTVSTVLTGRGGL